METPQPVREKEYARWRIQGARVLLALIAISLIVVAARKGFQAYRYFSPQVALTATVAYAELTDPRPKTPEGPISSKPAQAIPTRLTMRFNEHQGLTFEAALRSDPGQLPTPPRPGSVVTLILPRLWRDLAKGNHVLAFGVREGNTVLVDAAKYPYTAEYRTAFLAVGAVVGAFVSALAAILLGRR